MSASKRQREEPPVCGEARSTEKSPGDSSEQPEASSEPGWRVSHSGDGVAALCITPSGCVALGLHAGPIVLLSEGGGGTRRLDGHTGGTLALAIGKRGFVSAGADGCVRVWSLDSLTLESAHSLDGGTRGVHGALVDTIAVSDDLWAAASGRCVCVGAIDGLLLDQLRLGPQPHAVDAVCWVGGDRGGLGEPSAQAQRLAAASFGGVTLWRRVSVTASAAPRFEVVSALPACQASPLAPLSFDGWARALAAAPCGGWLAASASLAVDEPQHVRLWRMADGADFVCAGHAGQVRALCWSRDSRLLVSCSGPIATLWRFRPGQSGPAGTAPQRLEGSGATLTAAAFAPGDGHLACGASDGSLWCFALGAAGAAEGAGTGPGPARRVWRAEGVVQGDAVEHLAWSSSGALLIACFTSGLVVAAPLRAFRSEERGS